MISNSIALFSFYTEHRTHVQIQTVHEFELLPPLTFTCLHSVEEHVHYGKMGLSSAPSLTLFCPDYSSPWVCMVIPPVLLPVTLLLPCYLSKASSVRSQETFHLNQKAHDSAPPRFYVLIWIRESTLRGLSPK